MLAINLALLVLPRNWIRHLATPFKISPHLLMTYRHRQGIREYQFWYHDGHGGHYDLGAGPTQAL